METFSPYLKIAEAFLDGNALSPVQHRFLDAVLDVLPDETTRWKVLRPVAEMAGTKSLLYEWLPGKTPLEILSLLYRVDSVQR